MKKIKLFSLFAAMLLATSMWATIPMGSVDGVTGHNGSFHVWGWALDPDQPSTTVAIHVYIYPKGNTNPVKGYNATVANLNRPDLKSSDPYSIGALYGTVHGFDCWIDITSEVPAGTYDVRVWPINVGSGEGNHTITYSDNSGDVKTITISNPYTVSYHANGGSGAPGAQRKVTNKNITLSNTTPTRAGYTFNGWNTASNGSGTNYAKGATYSANASATLYAKWNLVNYSISYTLNGGSVTGNPTSYNVTTNTFTLKNPTRTGYTFAGWTGSNGSTKQTSVTINKGSTGDKSYTANWTANTYTITLDWQGGATGDASKTATFGSATPTVNIPGRNGYSFGGYYTGKNGTGTQYLKPGANNTATSVRNWDIASNTTLYAKWNARTYTVTFDQQGGNGGTASTTATFDANMPSATMPSKTGYTFQGYYDATSEGTKYYNADGSSARTWNKTANTTLYARWAPVNYTITYNLDGGNATNPANYNIETATFTLNNPTKEHNDFLGWTGSNGSTPQTTVTINNGSTGDKTYTANWSLHTYSVSTDESMASDWSVTASPVGVGQTVTATYTGTKHVKSVSYLGVPVLTAPTAKSGLIYTGSAQELVNAGSSTGGTMQYKVNEGEWSDAVPSATNAGTYTVYYRVQGSETYAGHEGGSFNVTIAKATVVLTAPTAKTNLTYNTNAQSLVNAGSTTAGTLQYKVGSGAWGTTIPSATNAGTYAVYYRVVGNDNYADVAETSFNVTIAKANPNMSISTTSISMTADDFSKDITVTRTGDGAITATSSNQTYAKPTVSGNKVTVHRAHGAATSSNVTITVNVAATTNYNAASKTCTYSQAVLRTPGNIVAADKGRFLGIYGYLWKSRADAAYSSEPLVAVVAYVGSCDKYFDKCLCIALEDISNNRLSRADAATAISTWASNHPVNVWGTVYSNDAGGYYDFASSSNYKIRDWAVAKGWRIPTVCDWRYIMNAYKGSSLTNPAGLVHGQNPNLCKWSELRTAINNATGGTAMKTDNNYGSSTRADGNSNIGTWHVGTGGDGWATWWWANDHDNFKYYYRAVFAY